jgi:hypothetical protein
MQTLRNLRASTQTMSGCPANSSWFDIRVQAEKVYGIKLLL